MYKVETMVINVVVSKVSFWGSPVGFHRWLFRMDP